MIPISYVVRWRSWVLGGGLLVGALGLYARTAAPSVMAGDSAEFQFAAPLGGVPHPTGYPLYMLLGWLATLGNPSDVAHRVTLLSALLAAATVALVALLVLRLTGRTLAALVAGLALTVAPGLWNAATISEVYALNVLLLALLAWALLLASQTGPQQWRWQLAAAFVTGLGFSHHGSFALIGVPLFLGSGARWVWQAVQLAHQEGRGPLRPALLLIGGCALAGLFGLSPWLYLFVQYARYGPFTGLDHGLPRHYFWGSPTRWNDVANHLFGGAIRGGIFRIPDGPTALETVRVLLQRLRFEFGLIGCGLGAVGCIVLVWRNRGVWLGSAWIAGMTCLYFALLGQAVQDSLVFTLPLLLPWALWIGVAVSAAYGDKSREPLDQRRKTEDEGRRSASLAFVPHLLALVFLALTLRWGYSRLPYGDKANQWLFRTFGEGVLERLEPSAAVLTRWEQGTTLQYLRLVEGQRPDVIIDIVEPEDVPWPTRAAERYVNRPVYIIGSEQDAAQMGAQPVWSTNYAHLFRLR